MRTSLQNSQDSGMQAGSQDGIWDIKTFANVFATTGSISHDENDKQVAIQLEGHDTNKVILYLARAFSDFIEEIEFSRIRVDSRITLEMLLMIEGLYTEAIQSMDISKLQLMWNEIEPGARSMIYMPVRLTKHMKGSAHTIGLVITPYRVFFMNRGDGDISGGIHTYYWLEKE